MNQIHHNIHWGLQDNYLSMPTDCPQRDERQGWQGDRAGECQGETFFFDNLTLYRKWMTDIRDSQREDGNLSDVAPAYWQLYSPNVTWPSAFTIIPNTLYVQFGDRTSIERHYDSMRRWLTFLAQYIKEDLIEVDNYGDWCVPPEEPSLIHSLDPARKDEQATAGHLLLLLQPPACGPLRDDARPAARGQGAVGPCRADEGSLQPEVLQRREGHVRQRHADLLPAPPCPLIWFWPTPREKVFGTLVENITVKTKGHIGTRADRRSVVDAQPLRLRPRGPGRAIASPTRPTRAGATMVEKGATTMWELWNGDTADPAMNSGNHVMLVGDMAAWLYEELAGIKADPAEPGFQHIVMKPHPAGRAQLGEGPNTVRSAAPSRGHWRLEGGALPLDDRHPGQHHGDDLSADQGPGERDRSRPPGGQRAGRPLRPQRERPRGLPHRVGPLRVRLPLGAGGRVWGFGCRNWGPCAVGGWGRVSEANDAPDGATLGHRCARPPATPAADTTLLFGPDEARNRTIEQATRADGKSRSC